jgi:rod shape-determining protein MreC
LQDWFDANKKLILILSGVTILVLCIMAVLTANKSKNVWGTNLTNAIFIPVQSLFTRSTSGIASIGENFANSKLLTQQNLELEKKVADLTNKNIELESYKVENDRLRNLLDVKSSTKEYKTVAAEIIAKDIGNWYSIITIDKGTDKGIALNQPVISPKGLVGHVTDVGKDWAKITTILNSGTSVGGEIIRTQDIAMLEGDAVLQSQGLCKMTYISKNSTAMSGDEIKTNGLGGIYPKGLLIGTIKNISTDANTISQVAVVVPSVDFEKLSEVLVILK